ncbi:MAG: ubiquinone anaerobic biosynthesis accessory factor UbiT [Saezia sp.]
MQIPDFKLPLFFVTIGQKLPPAPPQLALTCTLNMLLKKGVLPADMTLLAGKHYEIDVLDAGLKVRFTATPQQFCQDNYKGEPDLRLAANTVDFMKMLLREEDPDTLFFNRKLQIEGDTELGLIVKNLLDSVDWSQTPLAKVVG